MDELIPKWLSDSMINLAEQLQTNKITRGQYYNRMIFNLRHALLNEESQPGNPDHGK